MSERTFAHCRVGENDLSISRKHMCMFVRVMTMQNDDESGRGRRERKKQYQRRKDWTARARLCVYIVLIQCVQEWRYVLWNWSERFAQVRVVLQETASASLVLAGTWTAKLTTLVFLMRWVQSCISRQQVRRWMRWVSIARATVRVAIWENICVPLINSRCLSGPPRLPSISFSCSFFCCSPSERRANPSLPPCLYFLSSLVRSAFASISID